MQKNYVIDLRFEVQRQQMLFKKRLARAVDESDDVEKYDYIVVNDTIKTVLIQ